MKMDKRLKELGYNYILFKIVIGIFSSLMPQRQNRRPRWYFGGLASAGAACFTHPLDLIKVHLQTQQEVKLRFIQIPSRIIKSEGMSKDTYETSLT